eukprot:5399578-Alexandrium_andersonii.AAC.1
MRSGQESFSSRGPANATTTDGSGTSRRMAMSSRNQGRHRRKATGPTAGGQANGRGTWPRTA